MNKAIFFKEWIKTRGLFFIALLVSLCFAGYVMMRHQPGHHFQGSRPPVGHLVESGYRVYRVVTIPAAHHRRTVRLVAVYSRNDAETAETDFTPSLSSATHDSIDVVGGSRANQHRLSVASRFLVDLPATTYRQRNGLAHIADSDSVVYLRLYRLPADGVDMPRTDVEAAHRQSADRRRYRANLFPARQTGSL